MGIGGAPIGLWGRGGLVVEGILVFFFRPVGERSVENVVMATI